MDYNDISKTFQKCNLPNKLAIKNNHGKCVLVEDSTKNNMIFGEVSYNKKDSNFYNVKSIDGKVEKLLYKNIKNVFTNGKD